MKHLRLALPFAVVTGALSVLTWDLWLLGCLGAAATVGLLVGRGLGRIGLPSLMAAGFLSGGAWGLLWIPSGGWFAPLGSALFGSVAATIFAPVVGAAEWIRARPGSLLDGVGARCALVCAVLMNVTFAGWFTLMGAPIGHRVPWALASGALLLGCVALDVWRFSSLANWTGDLGVGDLDWRFANEGSPYRQEARVISVVRGDFNLARRIFLRHLVFDAGAVAFALAGITGVLRT